MTELNSLPPALRAQLERNSDSRFDPNQRSEGTLIRQGGSDLARSQPELAALLMAVELGKERIVATTCEIDTLTDQVELKLFGIRVGWDTRITTRTKRITKTLDVW